MGESTKALLGAFIFLAGFGILIVWFAVGIPSTPIVWGLRIGLPIAVAVCGALLFWASRREDLAPDFLRQILGKPFERDGMCFSIIPLARNGTCYLNIVFQNQYASSCKFRVVVSPPAKSLLGKHFFAGVALDIECDGGAVGIARAPIGIPAQYQGRKTGFEVAAATKYLEGRGELLRFRNGLRAGKADTSGLGSLTTTFCLLALGHVHVTRPATVKFTPPVGVAEEVLPSQESTVEILWKPGDAVEHVADSLRDILAGI